MILPSGRRKELPSGGLFVDDVFSTSLYDGNSTARSIVNGIDLAGEGGMVWITRRSAAFDHLLFDTDRGVYKRISSNITGIEVSDIDTLTSFNGDGFSVGNWLGVNATGSTYASWTFRKAPKFFDVVTWTGDGAATKTLNHDLGIAPGMIFVKNLTSAVNWPVYHRSLTGTDYSMLLNTTAAEDLTENFSTTDPTDTQFTVGTSQLVNDSGDEYVAYLFAHDTDPDGLIQCGSYTGTGSPSVPVSLGWEPQYILVKNKSTQDWYVMDSMRALTDTEWTRLIPNLSSVEATDPVDTIKLSSDGFIVGGGDASLNSGGGIYTYMAIRRPNKPPESATEVFAIDGDDPSASNPAFTAGFPVDMGMTRDVSADAQMYLSSRLVQGKRFRTDSGASQNTSAFHEYDYQNGWGTGSGGNDVYSWMFKRAPGFFDVVTYSGTGANRTIKHNLAAIPEMIIIKRRTGNDSWWVYHANNTANPETDYLLLDVTAATGDAATIWNDTAPTDEVFSLGTESAVNGTAANDYTAHLFATLAGISKVGGYIGDGSSGKVIDCGFSAGARFVLIKRADALGAWFTWDTTRGIVAGNDPYIVLNDKAAEIATDDPIDPDNSGFIVNQEAGVNINVNTAEYVFLAIA